MQDGQLLADAAQLFFTKRRPFAAAVAGEGLAGDDLAASTSSSATADAATSLTAAPNAENVSRSLSPTLPNMTLPTCSPMP